MKKYFKTRRSMITAVCLIVGLLLLTTSVYANYDSANGYSSYKTAAKNLLLDTRNVTINADLQYTVDETLIEGTTVEYKHANNAASTHTIDYGKLNQGERYEYKAGSKAYDYNPETNEYVEYGAYFTKNGTLLDVDLDEDINSKLVRFLELGMDMVIGDLKNNVVLTDKTSDTYTYEINVSASQMPEIVNAGIALLFSATNSGNANRSGVYFEDSEKLVGMLGEEKYGVNFGEMFRECEWNTAEVYADYGFESEDELWRAYDECWSEAYNRYEYILDDTYGSEGILYVDEDGAYEYFPTYREYVIAIEDGNDIDSISAAFGENPYVSGARMTATVSKDGKLLANYMEGTLTGTDENGVTHRAMIKVDIKASEYGTTVPDKFDPTGKTLIGY